LKGNSNTRTLSTPNAVSNGPSAQLEMRIHGASNAFSSIFPRNHHVRISSGVTTIADTTYGDFGSVLIQKVIAPNLIGTNTPITTNVIDDIGASLDNNLIGYIKLSYARNCTLNFTSTRSFLFSPKVGGSRLSFRQYGNVNKTRPVVYNTTTGERIIPFRQSDSIQFVLDGVANQQIALYDSTDAQVLVPEAVAPLVYNSGANPNYLIVYHKNFEQGTQQLANYRSSQAGGAYNVAMVDVNQLYDYFCYGEKNPLAIRNFVRYAFNQQTQDPEFLMLVGKAYQNSLIINNANLYGF
jgi:hypothetical protein